MSVLAIELNDAGIGATKDTEPGMEAYAASPGIALWDGDTLVTGHEASRRARLKPRWSHDRFWQELDTAPLPPPFPAHLRRADLAHAHLQEIWSATQSGVEDVILAIPGAFSTEQLGLILGIARSCRIPVGGMIDQAVAASLLAPDSDHIVHLDIHLHRAVATKVTRGSSLERTELLVDDETGMVRLFDTWMKFLAQAFVRTTRFDPLHRGETEQALYRRLPEWLQTLRQRESAVLDLSGTDKTYSIEMTREGFLSAVEPLLERIAELARSAQRVGERTTLLVTPAVAALPGMLDSLKDSEVEAIALPASAGAMGALKLKHAIRSGSGRSEGLSFLTRVPLDVAPAKGRAEGPGLLRDSGPPTIDSEPVRPTHVLCDGLAHPITSRPLVLGLEIPGDGQGIDLSTLSGSTAGISRSHCSIYERDGRVLVEDHSSYGSFLNDRRVEGTTALAPGDRLRLGTPGIELRLIKIADSNGTPKD